MMRSRLYVGSVSHHRLTPVEHRFRQRTYSLCIDLDELGLLQRRHRLLSIGRPNLWSFYERDHGDGRETGLRDWVEGHVGRYRRRGSGRVELLCFPRVFGYGFNPLAVFFCYGDDGRLEAILYQVTNTFEQRHSYAVGIDPADPSPSHRIEKRLYVSPLIELDGHYRFEVAPPAERFDIRIDLERAAGAEIVTHYRGARAELSDRTLAWLGVTRPLLSQSIIAGIHWHAFRIWRKGAPHVARPEPPAAEVTHGPALPAEPPG